MDALLAFGVNWKLLVIQAVNFGLLLFLLQRYLFKPLFAMLEKRQQTIAKGLEDAAAAARAKEDAREERIQIVGVARAEGGKIVEELRKQAVESEREILRTAQEKSRDIIREAETKAGEEREHLLRESEKEVARMAVLAAEKILKASH